MEDRRNQARIDRRCSCEGAVGVWYDREFSVHRYPRSRWVVVRGTRPMVELIDISFGRVGIGWGVVMIRQR